MHVPEASSSSLKSEGGGEWGGWLEKPETDAEMETETESDMRTDTDGHTGKELHTANHTTYHM